MKRWLTAAAVSAALLAVSSCAFVGMGSKASSRAAKDVDDSDSFAALAWDVWLDSSAQVLTSQGDEISSLNEIPSGAVVSETHSTRAGDLGADTVTLTRKMADRNGRDGLSVVSRPEIPTDETWAAYTQKAGPGLTLSDGVSVSYDDPSKTLVLTGTETLTGERKTATLAVTWVFGKDSNGNVYLSKMVKAGDYWPVLAPLGDQRLKVSIYFTPTLTLAGAAESEVFRVLERAQVGRQVTERLVAVMRIPYSGTSGTSSLPSPLKSVELTPALPFQPSYFTDGIPYDFSLFYHADPTELESSWSVAADSVKYPAIADGQDITVAYDALEASRLMTYASQGSGKWLRTGESEYAVDKGKASGTRVEFRTDDADKTGMMSGQVRSTNVIHVQEDGTLKIEPRLTDGSDDVLDATISAAGILATRSGVKYKIELTADTTGVNLRSIAVTRGTQGVVTYSRKPDGSWGR